MTDRDDAAVEARVKARKRFIGIKAVQLLADNGFVVISASELASLRALLTEATARAVKAEAERDAAQHDRRSIREAVEQERESCALVADTYQATTQFPSITIAIALRIRARGRAALPAAPAAGQDGEVR